MGGGPPPGRAPYTGPHAPLQFGIMGRPPAGPDRPGDPPGSTRPSMCGGRHGRSPRPACHAHRCRHCAGRPERARPAPADQRCDQRAGRRTSRRPCAGPCRPPRAGRTIHRRGTAACAIARSAGGRGARRADDHHAGRRSDRRRAAGAAETTRRRRNRGRRRRRAGRSPRGVRTDRKARFVRRRPVGRRSRIITFQRLASRRRSGPPLSILIGPKIQWQLIRTMGRGPPCLRKRRRAKICQTLEPAAEDSARVDCQPRRRAR